MGRYLQPLGPLLPATGDTNVHYFVRFFEDVDGIALQLKVNTYLLLLEDPALPQFGLIGTEYGHYVTNAPMPEGRHTVMLTIMWVAGPIGFNPPPP